MEERNNLYLFDDFCIILSYILFILLLIELRPLWLLLSENRTDLLMPAVRDLLAGSPLKMGGLFFSALFLQILGRGVRKKEKEFLAVINTLGHSGRYSLQALAFELGITEKKLSRTLEKLAALPRSGIIFDGTYVKKEREKMDPGLSAARFRIDPAVSSSTTKFTEPSRAEGGEDKPQTEGPRPRTTLPHTPIPGESAKGDAEKKEVPFNIAIFLILFFVFWPAAFVYAARGALRNSQQKALGK